eukprot:Blabericola_migrator_1__4401@NODE_2362_length_2877_cov_8_949822_g1480_i0_p1_GENE_NODE_2362_length_2877_cov_8_949822_g1480_i0NODE_2362_length_2877_cov_8_949822_g1480_i0_p1_ORF_typecomplete_len105_score9_29_NODE_2362_length_2877_cov_8_949822_g1480_i012751589
MSPAERYLCELAATSKIFRIHFASGNRTVSSHIQTTLPQLRTNHGGPHGQPHMGGHGGPPLVTRPMSLSLLRQAARHREVLPLITLDPNVDLIKLCLCLSAATP